MERETAASSVSSAWVNIRIILTHTPPSKSSYLHACVFVWIKPNLYITKKNILRMSKRPAQLLDFADVHQNGIWLLCHQCVI